ncbi:MAG: hypothetical protein R3C02_18775 [Planctomycetaceae bacterium]
MEVTVAYTILGGASTSLDFTVPLADDGVAESSESFRLQLGNPHALVGTADIGSTAVTTSITNADDEVSFSLTGSSNVSEDPSNDENDLDNTSHLANYTVSYAGQLADGETASVDIAHSLGGTAGYEDFQKRKYALDDALAMATPGTGVTVNGTTVTFIGGSGNATDFSFSISIEDDIEIEGPETYSVSIANSTGTVATSITAASVETTIVSDDDNTPAEVDLNGPMGRHELPGTFDEGDVPVPISSWHDHHRPEYGTTSDGNHFYLRTSIRG